MQEIIVTGATDAPPSEVKAKLDPESIVEYTGVYEIVGAETVGGKRVLDVLLKNRKGEPTEATLEFTHLDDGYAFTQRDDTGPFEEMWTVITVEDDSSGAKIHVHSEYTFGGLLRFVFDRLAVGYRKQELERLVSNLVTEVEDGDPNPDD